MSELNEQPDPAAATEGEGEPGEDAEQNPAEDSSGAGEPEAEV